MTYKKEHQCEMCGKITIAKTSRKRFCANCKKINQNEWRKEWLKNPKNLRKHRKRVEIARLKYPKTQRKKQKRYSNKYPDKIKAHQLAKSIPLKSHCQICKTTERLERHHWDYGKPLIISTLCKDCHTIQHIKHFAGGN